MNVIKQIQQAIVYIEDRILEPFHLQDLSDYVGLSPMHLDQSFKMIVGMSPSEYATARKLTKAAEDVIVGAFRLIDIAKKFGYQDTNEFANAFSDYHGVSPIQAKIKQNQLKMQERLYLRISTTDTPPYSYRLEQSDEYQLIGFSRFIDTEDLSNPFVVADFLEDLKIDGSIKDLQRYNDISPHELFVVKCPLDNGAEIFVGVPSERYPVHMENRILPSRQYAKFNLQGEIDFAVNEAWHYIETRMQLTIPYEKDSLYVEIYPFDISFEDSFTKIQLWVPINPDDQ